MMRVRLRTDDSYCPGSGPIGRVGVGSPVAEAGERRRDRLVTRLSALVLLVALLGAAPPTAPGDELEITGQILYDGRTNGADRAAVVDILRVYNHNPIYMYMKSLGLRETDPAGRPLFALARKATDRALTDVARSRKIDVITVPGGVRGGSHPIPDLTTSVIDRLPVYHVHGTVHYGRAVSAKRIAQLDSRAVLAAIPAYQEARALDQSDARFHLLRRRYLDELNRVVQRAARLGDYDAVVERGGVTSRLGAVPDITSTAIGAIDT
jgi:hypothetical protein